MRHHHEDPRQAVIPFMQAPQAPIAAQKNLSVEYHLSIFGNDILMGHIRSDLAGIVGGSGDVVSASILSEARREIELALERRGMSAKFTEDKIIIKPADQDRKKELWWDDF
jgi:hypothetical protein